MGASGLVPDSYRRALCGALRVPRCLRQAACLPNGTPLRALPTVYAALLSPTVLDALHPFLRRLCVQRMFPRGYAVWPPNSKSLSAAASSSSIHASASSAAAASSWEPLDDMTGLGAAEQCKTRAHVDPAGGTPNSGLNWAQLSHERFPEF